MIVSRHSVINTPGMHRTESRVLNMLPKLYCKIGTFSLRTREKHDGYPLM